MSDFEEISRLLDEAKRCLIKIKLKKTDCRRIPGGKNGAVKGAEDIQEEARSTALIAMNVFNYMIEERIRIQNNGNNGKNKNNGAR